MQGKTRGTVEVDVTADALEIEKLAKDECSKWLNSKIIKKVIMPTDKNVINFVLEK